MVFGSWPTVWAFSTIKKETLLVKFVPLCLHGQHLQVTFWITSHGLASHIKMLCNHGYQCTQAVSQILHILIQKELNAAECMWGSGSWDKLMPSFCIRTTHFYGGYYHLTFGLIALNSQLLVNSRSLSCNMIYNSNSLWIQSKLACCNKFALSS